MGQDNSNTKTQLIIAVSSKFGESDNTTNTNKLKVPINTKDDEAGEDVAYEIIEYHIK